MSISVPTDALISLANHYEVCDGGETVKVNRLALAEVLVYVQLTRPDLPQPVCTEDDGTGDADRFRLARAVQTSTANAPKYSVPPKLR